jgi:hypothetical protein
MRGVTPAKPAQDVGLGRATAVDQPSGELDPRAGALADGPEGLQPRDASPQLVLDLVRGIATGRADRVA